MYVGSGPGNDSATINGGIGLASPGDTVFVYSGTYVENVVVDKTLNLTGENRDTTIIDGGGIGPVVEIFGTDWVNVTGFTITNGSGDGVYIWFDSDYNTIEDNIIRDNGNEGIEINTNSDNNTVANNSIDNSRWGVHLANGDSNNNILNNIINDSQLWYLFLEF